MPRVQVPGKTGRHHRPAGQPQVRDEAASIGAASAGLLQDALRGLSERPRWLPSKHFYDERGSQLFDAICEQPEYYVTRSELAIMREHAPEIARLLGPRCLLVEYGSGSGVKTRLLLDHLEEPAAYVPLDISREQLQHASARIAEAYPEVEVVPLCADFTAEYQLPPTTSRPRRRAVYFPGSTIGNFTPEEARGFLRHIAAVCAPQGLALIGVDLEKPVEVLEPAYNDAAEVTERFNLNLLARLNRELDADFRLDRFAHRAFYNPAEGRIEMHLESLEAQTVRIEGYRFDFAPGDRIRTEYSYKYTPERFAHLAESAGLCVERAWTDRDRMFSMCLLAVGPDRLAEERGRN
jgi:dimethylhistidine N-methyltransferase